MTLDHCFYVNFFIAHMPIELEKPKTQFENPPSDELTEDDFGLHALRDILSMKYADFTSFSLGQDIQALGLPISGASKENSKTSERKGTQRMIHPEKLMYPAFHHLWSSNNIPADASQLLGPTFATDISAKSEGLPFRVDQLAKLHFETLLYIFYSYPQDVVQMAVAAELYRREWTYDVPNNRWFLATLQCSGAMKSTESTDELEGERSRVFDPDTWTCEIKPMKACFSSESENPTRDFTAALRSISSGVTQTPVSFGLKAKTRNDSVSADHFMVDSHGKCHGNT